MFHFDTLLLIFSLICTCNNSSYQSDNKSNTAKFNIEKDLLLLNYDCKTDVDDLHSIAAIASLIRTKEFSNLNYHAVAGAYGIQEGLYVPGESLFEMAFETNWSDAHKNYTSAQDDVFNKCKSVLNKDARIWIAEAGQSDFSADLCKRIISEFPKLNTKDKIKIVQHSEWNESVTESTKLNEVRSKADYIKIQDGNAEGNGTPGFNCTEMINWESKLDNAELIEIWKLAINLSHQYNGMENRYLNQTIKNGGFDFSDFCEVHYILNIKDVENCMDFFDYIENR